MLRQRSFLCYNFSLELTQPIQLKLSDQKCLYVFLFSIPIVEARTEIWKKKSLTFWRIAFDSYSKLQKRARAEIWKKNRWLFEKIAFDSSWTFNSSETIH